MYFITYLSPQAWAIILLIPHTTFLSHRLDKLWWYKTINWVQR